MSEYPKISTGVGTLKTYTDASSLLEDAMQYVLDHPEKHDQGIWIQASDLSTLDECGTGKGCLAGWMAVLDKQRLWSSYGRTRIAVDGDTLSFMEWAKGALGLDEEVACALFDVRCTVEMLEAGVKAYLADEGVIRAMIPLVDPATSSGQRWLTAYEWTFVDGLLMQLYDAEGHHSRARRDDTV